MHQHNVAGGNLIMKENTPIIEDGEFPCSATLNIKDGKAVVVLHTTFGFPSGAKIPLHREGNNILIETFKGSEVSFLNGHSII